MGTGTCTGGGLQGLEPYHLPLNVSKVPIFVMYISMYFPQELVPCAKFFSPSIWQILCRAEWEVEKEKVRNVGLKNLLN